MWNEMRDVEMGSAPTLDLTTWPDMVRECREQDWEELMCQDAANNIRPRSDLYRSLADWLKRHLGAGRQTVEPGHQAKQGELEWTGKSMVL